MGMSIDKAIEFFNGLEGHTLQAKDARNVAIETMRKYQRIEEVINRLKDVNDHTTSIDLLFEIEEIIEDGNDD